MYSKTNIFYIIFIGFILLLDTESYPYYEPFEHHHHHGYEGNYGAYPYQGRAQCFSADSLIKLSNGEYKQIDNLKSGDEIITIEQSKIISTEMIMMLDRQISKEALFYKLTTDSGNEISLTEYHLIPIMNFTGNKNYLFAKQIQIGDYLFVLSNDKLIHSPVVNITIEMKKGYYAPLTMKGTLLINNILASCFANINDHYLAQYSMAPFRYYYKFTRLISLRDPFNINKTEGLHWTVNYMFHFARYFKSDVLFL
ncbi:unnamed protein product [Adineta steineri]|uniref:Hint domain-containing protein n=1 Tax=Adineta steineri TaxID=433720 RepID=A0A815RKK5_9BILA|nr:unnamed protein product [Adineta steineri]CAF1637602.1 unnamed protein product [Adineta steineri]